MNKIILIFSFALFSISTICATKNHNGSKKLSNANGNEVESLNSIASHQAQGIMETPPTEYIGNSELGKSTYDQEITNLDQVNNLDKTRNTLKSESYKTNIRSVILILLTLLVGLVIGIFVKRK